MISKLVDIERDTWRTYSTVIEGFLGNKRSSEYVSHVNELMKSFEKLEARMSIKIHFLQSHLDYFPENCRNYSEEQSERFHQEKRWRPDIKDVGT